MNILLTLKSFSWCEFYGVNVDISGDITKKTMIEQKEMYIKSCTFISINAVAISCQNVKDCKVLIEESLFNGIKNLESNQGGAVYFSSNGNIALNKVCGFECRSKNYGSFCSISVNGKDYLNSVKQTTASNCGAKESQMMVTLLEMGGEASAHSLNISFSIQEIKSTLEMKSDKGDAMIEYCTFADNEAFGSDFRYNPIGFNFQKSVKILFCNILRNNNNNNRASGNLISFEEGLYIANSCIYDNNKDNKFATSNSKQAIITNCTTDIKKGKIGRAVIENPPAKDFINNLFHLELLDKCVSLPEEYDELKPEKKPEEEEEKKPEVKCVCSNDCGMYSVSSVSHLTISFLSLPLLK